MNGRATAIPMVGGSRLDEPQPQKEESKIRRAHHPARGLNLRNHTNQEAHDAPRFGARGTNTGSGMAVPGGAPLCHSCYGSVLRKIGRIYTALTPKLLKYGV